MHLTRENLAASLLACGDGIHTSSPLNPSGLNIFQILLPTWTGAYSRRRKLTLSTRTWMTIVPTHVIPTWKRLGTLHLTGEYSSFEVHFTRRLDLPTLQALVASSTETIRLEKNTARLTCSFMAHL
jgi:hypothetical protein